MHELFTVQTLQIIVTGFLVGGVVGVTGMGGGALMTPALIFLGVGSGSASTIVTADLTAAAVYKTGGAIMHSREGKPNFRLAGWLIAGSVPFALAGPFLLRWAAPSATGDSFENFLKICIGWALMLAAATYALRLWINLVRVRHGVPDADPDPKIRAIPTLLVGALGGLLVGVTSVGSGSVIMVALLMMYPGLAALRLVGTDLVQAVPLVLAAAISNIASNGLEWKITVPLILGSVPGTLVGSKLAPRFPTSVVRRGIVIVLVMSGIALLAKGGWGPAKPFGDHPILLGLVGLALIVLVPLLWGLIRRSNGLPMYGAPTVAELEGEGPRQSLIGKRADQRHSPGSGSTEPAAEPGVRT